MSHQTFFRVDTAEGPSSKTSRSNGGGSESESEMNQRSNGAAPEAKKSAAALNDLESRTVSGGPVGKGYKRCPKCGKVQNASCVKCAKCSFVFVHKSRMSVTLYKANVLVHLLL